MATTTVTPDTTTEPAATGGTGGTLTSILAPVEPARPVAPIGSTASMAEEPAATSSKPGKVERNSGPVREHPIGALVRAIATRLARPSTSNHVKRQHTITESRTSGGSNTTTNANRSNRDGKNHQIGQHRTARDEKVADNNSKIRQQQGREQRDVKSHDTKASTNASRDGRDVKDHKDAKTSGASSKQDVVHQTGRDGLNGRPGKGADGKSAKDADTKPTSKDAPAKDGAAAGKGSDAKQPDTAKPNTDQKPKATPQDKTTDTPAKPRPRTQPSREAGYHDGTVAAKVTGHVKAYRDGAKDGYADGTAEYEREKRRMDAAKARNATKPDKAPSPKMQPASGSTVDLAKKEQAAAPADAVPVQLTGISASHVSFDADGNSHTLPRSEVRTLKGFEQRIAAKVPVLQQIAETSKTTRAKAADHATRALRLAEAAKDIEGGSRLVAKLQRLAEAAQALHAKTEEIEKHAHRGAEALRVLNANAQTRHGGIYKAVADSPLTKPAEREFYQDGQS